MSGDWVRVPPDAQTRAWAEQSGEPGLRVYQRPVPDGHLTVLVAQAVDPAYFAGPRWHLSISHRTNTHPPKPGRLPSWEEISEARYRFIPDRAQVAMFLPPRAQFVNAHSTTMHLWEVEPDRLLDRLAR